MRAFHLGQTVMVAGQQAIIDGLTTELDPEKRVYSLRLANGHRLAVRGWWLTPLPPHNRERRASMDDLLFAIVRKCCEGLDNLELVTLNISVQFNGDPPERIFNEHEAIQGLFTENEGTRMCEETREALALVTKERLAGEANNKDRLGS